MPIPVRDAKGNIIEYRKEPNGQVVVSRLDEASLARIATLTGGRYFKASTSESEIADLYRDISGLEKKDLESKVFQNFEDRFQYPLFMAVLLLIFYLAVSEKRRERESWMKRWKILSAGSKVGSGAVILILFCALPGVWASTPASKNKEGNRLFQQKKYAEAEKAYVDAQVEAPGRPELLYNTGNALIKQKSYDQAVQSLRQAIGKADKGLQQNSWYNLGNAFFEMGKTGDAIEAYIQALRMNPADRDAKRNLELALRKREEQKQQQQQSNQNQNQQPNQDQQNKEQNAKNQNQQQQSQPNQDKAANPKATQAEGDNKNFSKERALQILDAIQSQEMTEQKKELERRFGRKSDGRDW
jgi:Ca-activated chloride channel family protein